MSTTGTAAGAHAMPLYDVCLNVLVFVKTGNTALSQPGRPAAGRSPGIVRYLNDFL